MLPHAVPLVVDILGATAARVPHKVALVCQKRRLTYAELDRASDALAGALASRGVARGDRVLVLGENTVETATAFWGVLKANAVVSLVSPQTKADKLRFLLHDCGARALVTEAHLAGVYEAALRDPAVRAHTTLTIVSHLPEAQAERAARLARVPGGLSWDDALAAAEPPPPRANIDVDLAC